MKNTLPVRIVHLCCALVACFSIAAQQTDNPRASDKSNSAVGQPAPAETDSQSKTSDRKISAHDILWVDVYGEKDLCGEKQVQATGNISFPFLGAVPVSGKTPAEVEKYLKEKLGQDYLVDPQVVVHVKQYTKRTVSVTGEVMRPGLIELPPDQQWGVLDAISAAGDLSKMAKKDILVHRKGRAKPLEFNFDELKKNLDPSKKFLLEPDDVVSVSSRIF